MWKIHTPIITTGNELVGDEISDFSKQMDRWQLYKYAKEVLESTNELLLANYDKSTETGDLPILGQAAVLVILIKHLYLDVLAIISERLTK